MDTIISVSESDKKTTMGFLKNNQKRFIVAPNGADVKKYRPRPIRKFENKIVLGFLGSFDLHLNIVAAMVLIDDILPKIRDRLTGMKIEVLLIGRNPPISIIKAAEKDPLIKITGTVENVSTYLNMVDIFVGFLRGGAGTKLRVFEAMATGLPIIGTHDLFEGIDGIIDGVNAILVNSKEECIEKIIKLIRQKETRESLSKNVRELAENLYSWDSITRKLSDDLIDARCCD